VTPLIPGDDEDTAAEQDSAGDLDQARPLTQDGSGKDHRPGRLQQQ
jgi:hypothetical protein